jgi:hypothetical protein
MFRTTVVAFALLMTVAVLPARAAGAEAIGASGEAITLASDTDWSLTPVQIGNTNGTIFGGAKLEGPKAHRGALLPMLYVSLAGLNAFDAYSTQKGLAHGAVEANPMMSGVVGNKAALWAVKGGVTAASIYLSERMWKQGHKAQAVAMMVLSNGVMAAVAAHNAQVIGR